MSRIFKILMLSAVVSLLAAGPTLAQAPACVKRADLLRQLETRFSEVPVARGVSENGGIVEVFAAKDGATWTVTITMPNGLSCMIAAGEAWENLPPKISYGPGA